MNRPSYKCVKHYPGGSEVGYILKPQVSHWNNMWYWYMNNWFNPEEFPEYWEKVVERKLSCGVTCNYQIINSYNPDHYTPASNIKWFDTEKDQLAWIEENKSQFSKKDMIEFANYSTKNFRFDNYPNLDYWINHVKK